MRIKTEIPLTAAFIKEALGKPFTDEDTKKHIRAICTDSREIKRGDLFIGISGETFDGSKFIPQIKKLASLTIGSPTSLADITLDDPNASLLLIAKKYKKLLHIQKTVAITGSVGKTTTKNLTACILKSKFKTHSTYKNLNNEIGVPFTVLETPENTEMLVVEAGMNHLGELQNISDCIEPDISVITKIGSAHIGNLGSHENIAKAKCEILHGMKNKFAIVPHGEKILYEKAENYKTVSLSNQTSDYILLENNSKGDSFTFKTSSSVVEFSLHDVSLANFHIKYALAFALATCTEIGMSVNELKAAVEKIDFSVFSNSVQVDDLTIINDSYNSSPEAVIAALTSLKSKKGSKSALLGDMLELGDFSEDMHFEIGLHASKCELDNLYVIGSYSNYIYEGAVAGGFDKNKIFINENPNIPETTANQILNHSSNEVILFKASRKIKLERIIDILKKVKK